MSFFQRGIRCRRPRAPLVLSPRLSFLPSAINPLVAAPLKKKMKEKDVPDEGELVPQRTPNSIRQLGQKECLLSRK